MLMVSTLRGGSDGPAKFYLNEIAKARLRPATESWDGVVTLEAK